jgi:hypothetical protein
MRRRPGHALRVGLAPQGVALVRTNAWQRGQGAVLAERVFGRASQAEIFGQLHQLLETLSPAGWPVSVVLSDELVRMWQVAPPPSTSRVSDLQAAAALRFQALFGAPASAWKISADWQAEQPFLAAAVPLTLLQQLQDAASAHRFHLVEIVPQFVAALNQWRKRRRARAWFGAVHNGVFTVAAFDDGALAALRATPVPVDADREWLDSFVARETLRLGLESPQCLQVCGAAPALWRGEAASSPFACQLLDAGVDESWSAIARLAVTGGVR